MAISLVVATPMYGGQCAAAYNMALNQLNRAIVSGGGRFGHIALANESLVNRARNSIVWQFLNYTSGDYLLFCDADQSFRFEDVLPMIDADKSVIAAPVPLKGIDWGAIGEAARCGVPDDELHLHGGIFNVEHHDNPPPQRASQPLRVNRVGCAFMLIQRHVFEKLADVLPSYLHDLPDPMKGMTVTEFFPTAIEEGRLMSEDYGFLNAWKRLGGEVWLAPWVTITHYGTFAFTGSYKVKHAAMA